MTPSLAIAKSLTPKEANSLAWWVYIYKPGESVMFTPSVHPEWESLHQKKLIWSPMWLAGTCPPWLRQHHRMARLWSRLSANRWTWRLTELFYKMPDIGPTKLGRQVAGMFSVSEPRPEASGAPVTRTATVSSE